MKKEDNRRMKFLSEEELDNLLRDPKVTTLMSISKALGISIDELFSETKQAQTTEELPKNISVILQILKKQDDKTLKVIQKQIEALLELG